MWIITQIREEPVMFQAVIQAGLAMLIGFQAIPGLSQENMGLILAFSAAVLGFITRKNVTPTSNPKNDDGKQLVPKTQ